MRKWLRSVIVTIIISMRTVHSRVQRDRVHAELGFGKYDNIPLECVKTVSYGGKVIYER